MIKRERKYRVKSEFCAKNTAIHLIDIGNFERKGCFLLFIVLGGFFFLNFGHIMTILSILYTLLQLDDKSRALSMKWGYK